MKNFFRRIYIKHDNDVVVSSSQKRMLVTNREFQYPFPTDPELLAAMNVVKYFQSMEEVDKAYNGRETFWLSMLNCNQPIVLIANREIFAELCIQYWKSIFKSLQVDVMYKIYQMVVRGENLLYRHHQASVDTDTNVTTASVDPLIFADFEAIYQATAPSELLMSLPRGDIPIEYLLVAYFGNTGTAIQRQFTLQKAREIILANVVAQLADAKSDFFLETHSLYLLDDDGEEKDIVDNMEYIQSKPEMSWLLDPEFKSGNEEVILKKYTLQQLKSFFVQYTKLFRIVYEEEVALDYIIANNIPGLLEYDARDEMGSFFSTEHYMAKINGLVVSYIYQQFRRTGGASLRQFELR